MIKLQLQELLGDRSHYWLEKTTGIEHSVIGNLATQKSQRIDYYTLEKFCVALDCLPGDLLVIVPNPPKARKRPKVRVATKRG
jgi:DNA-binding Xre family transcriptional regulator